MNKIGFFVITAFILNIVSSQQAPSNISIIEKFLYQRCRSYSTDAAVYDDIRSHFGQFSDYLTYAASLLPNGKEQFCEDERPKLIGLARNLASEGKRCMPKDEKYLPGFVYESFSNFLNFICQGRYMESFFSSQGAECRQTLKQNNAGEAVGNCFKKMFARFSDTVGKDDLCLDLKAAKQCFGKILREHCEAFAAFESLNNKFFDAIREPCNKPSAGVPVRFSAVILIFTFLLMRVF